MTGEVNSKVALASREEVRAAVQNAGGAQPAWAATNPQRARRSDAILNSSNRTSTPWPNCSRASTARRFADAQGEIQRGVEVIEFCIGVPHLMKGEFTNSAAAGLDVYSMRQPLGVVAGITPFNFPVMIPMWKFAPAIACGNAFILKPSERDPGAPCFWPN